MTEWTVGDRCRVVEHDNLTRKRRGNGEVMQAAVIKAEGLYVQARCLDGSHAGTVATFWASSGWTAWDGSFRWRLLPVDDETATAAGEDEDRND